MSVLNAVANLFRRRFPAGVFKMSQYDIEKERKVRFLFCRDCKHYGDDGRCYNSRVTRLNMTTGEVVGRDTAYVRTYGWDGYIPTTYGTLTENVCGERGNW